MGKAGAVNARLLYFYIETNEKDFDYEKATLVIYGNMFGSDARFAIM